MRVRSLGQRTEKREENASPPLKQTHKQNKHNKHKQNKHKNTTKNKRKKLAFSHDLRVFLYPDLITSLDHYINDDNKVLFIKRSNLKTRGIQVFCLQNKIINIEWTRPWVGWM